MPCGSKERKRWYTWGELQQVAEQVRSFARALFVEARALLANGRISEACERLELSNARSATIGTLLNLELCCVQLGRLGRAYEYYQRAHQAAVGRADSARAGVAGAELQRLAPMLGIITPITLSPSGSNTVEMSSTAKNNRRMRGDWLSTLTQASTCWLFEREMATHGVE